MCRCTSVRWEGTDIQKHHLLVACSAELQPARQAAQAGCLSSGPAAPVGALCACCGRAQQHDGFTAATFVVGDEEYRDNDAVMLSADNTDVRPARVC